MTGREAVKFILAVALPTAFSFCFTSYNIRPNGSYKCTNKMTGFSGQNLAECCAVDGAVGYTAKKRGRHCEICEAALPPDDLLLPVWSDWGQWSDCSRTCDTGVRSRSRNCIRGDCEGLTTEEEDCKIDVCPIWSDWGQWSDCSRTCDTGVRSRSRNCIRGDCKGPTTKIRDCKINDVCPIRGKWGEWESWSSCSRACGQGVRSRIRRCDNPIPMYGGLTCLQQGGYSIQEEPCFDKENCPIDGSWGRWKDFSACSQSCGPEAVRVRSRDCDNPVPMFDGLPCPGPSDESVNCQLSPCPIDGQWGEWSKWEACSKTCGLGQTKRKRNCNNPKPQYNGNPCPGLRVEKKECDSGRICIAPAQWSEWALWTPCSNCEKIYYQKRTRECQIPAGTKDYYCDGSSYQTHSCTSESDCIVDDTLESSGDGCVGDECCDDADGCWSEVDSFSSSSDEPVTNAPLPTKCIPTIEDDDSISTSTSTSNNPTDKDAGFRWVVCPEEEPTTMPPDDCDSSSGDCFYKTEAPEDDSISDYEPISSEPITDKPSPVDNEDSISSSTDYESSNTFGGGGVKGGSSDSFSSL